MVELFVEFDGDIKKLLEKATNKIGSQNKLSKKLGISRTCIYNWFKKKSWVSFDVLHNICDLLNIDFLKFLEGKKVHNRGKGPEIFSQDWLKLNPRRTYFLGWLSTDGHIAKNSCRIHITQKDRNVLKKLKKILIEEYPLCATPEIYKDIGRSTSRLLINSPLLWWAAVRYFDIPCGKKSHTVGVSERIIKSDYECKWSFLVACFEGDGTFPTVNQNYLSLRVNSKNFVDGLDKITNSLGIKAWKARLYNNMNLFALNKRENIIEFSNYFLEYGSFIDKFNKFINDDYFKNLVETFTIPIDKVLLKKAWLKLGKAKLISEYLKYSGVDYTYKTIKNFVYDKNKEYKIRLLGVLALSELIKEDYVPEKYKNILKIYGEKHGLPKV